MLENTVSFEHSQARAGRACFTVNEFCDAHRLSRAQLYNLWNAGIGPRWMANGSRRLISVEAAADWRREREAASAMQGVARTVGVLR
jgi:hypothetical protein